MKLVLMRHAQKGLQPFEDPALTEEGFDQAEKIARLVRKAVLPKPTHIWVSPKIRTTQTFQALSKASQVQIQETNSLDLHLQSETSAEFRHRIQNFLDKLQENLSERSNETHFICTHFDWIEESMALISCDKNLNSFEFSHWSPTQYILFQIDSDQWTFLKKGSAHDAKSD